MQKLNYQLKTYIKAVEILTIRKGFESLKIHNKSGSAVHFELFLKGEIVPHNVWQVHTEHNKRKNIISKEDYKKGAKNLNISLEEFIEILKENS